MPNQVVSYSIRATRASNRRARIDDCMGRHASSAHVGSTLRRRAAPARQIIGVLALGELQRPLDRMIEVAVDGLALDPAPQKVRPKEFAEGRRVLGESSGSPQFAGERTVRIIHKLVDRFGNVLVAASATLVVEGMHPAAIVEDKPESVALE